MENKHCATIRAINGPCTRHNGKSEYPHSTVGYCKGDLQLICLPPKYPNGGLLRNTCILHEMMHTAGFKHEQSRKDNEKHLVSDEHDNIPIG